MITSSKTTGYAVWAWTICLSSGWIMAADTLRLKPGVPVVVAPSEPGPVLRAAEDLRRDLQWVLNAPSPRLDRPPADPNLPAIVITSQSADSSVRGAEAHAVSVQGQRVVLQGADMRGAIYAIYSFSDLFLDMPPWWFWAGWKPKPRRFVEVAADTDLHWKSPQVKWRAWFPNDTDLLSPWMKNDYETRWNLMVETMLRLKLNMIDIGELFDDSIRKVRIPRDRGLAITTTHLAPFGATLKNWGKYWSAQGQSVPPPLTLANVSGLEQFWEHHIRIVQKEKLEMLWMIGFRGDGDKGFYKTFADAPADDAGRAKNIQNMMQRQVTLLKKVTGEAHPAMRTVLYDECSDYVASGLLHPPDEPSLIWNFVAARRDHFPAADLRQYRAPAERLLGYYFNIQFTSTGSHLADGEGPWKMEKNHRIVLESGSNFVFSVVNSGNTREFSLTLQAHARMMWDFNRYDSSKFVEEFCQRYWEPEHGARVAKLYRDYFEAYWQQRKADLPDFPRQYIFQDLRIARATRELMTAARLGQVSDALLDDRGMGYFRIVPTDNGTTSKLDAVISGNTRAAEQFAVVADQCAALSPQLAPQGRTFFDQSLRVQASFMAAASRCLVAVAQGFKVKSDQAAFEKWMRQAEAEAKAMQAALQTAATGPFTDWYVGEKVFGLKETQDMIARRTQGSIKPAR
ncbi:MAG: glycosyl hydrolase 115 family protein [Verrucomicrobiota bacterium]